MGGKFSSRNNREGRMVVPGANTRGNTRDNKTGLNTNKILHLWYSNQTYSWTLPSLSYLNYSNQAASISTLLSASVSHHHNLEIILYDLYVFIDMWILHVQLNSRLILIEIPVAIILLDLVFYCGYQRCIKSPAKAIVSVTTTVQIRMSPVIDPVDHRD